MVCHDEIIVDGFRNTDKTDAAFIFGCIAGELADRIHGIISAYIEDGLNLIFRKFCKQLRINRIGEIFRKLVTAGAKIGTRCCLQKRKRAVFFQGTHIHHVSI